VKVTYVFVFKSSVSAFPSRDAAAAVAQCDEARVYVRGAEAVEEISLAGDFAFVEVSVSEFSDVDLIWLISWACLINA
jgi:hypothetical protein